ncbi:MAG: hypothetical protein FWC67_00955 [Defluviitaleaceae bacterium]|nr:hypothetical protein [Defluviitaleaceae bacterium]
MNYENNQQEGINKDDYTRDKRVEQNNTPPPPPPPPHHGHMPYGSHPYYKPRKPSRFVLFILASLPGLGHMYLGLIRRGLFYVSASALSIFLTVQLAVNFTFFVIPAAFSIAVVYAVAFFESLAIRSDMVMGKEVADKLPAFLQNKSVVIKIGIFLAILLGASFLATLPWYGWAVIGIVGVCATIFLRPSSKTK